MVEETKSFNFVDPSKRPNLSRSKIELEARIYHEENNLKFPELTHVPPGISPDHIPDDYTPHESIVHFVVPDKNRS